MGIWGTGAVATSHPVIIRLHQGCPLSLIMFVDRISRFSQGELYGALRIAPLHFADNVDLLLSSDSEL